MNDIEQLFVLLQQSRFRSQFRLKANDIDFLRNKGGITIRQHALDFVISRLSPADIANDGKQTPYRGHPVFVAQHATACCCRSCLQKWHGIQQGRTLTKAECHYIVKVLMAWLKQEWYRWQP